MREDGLPDMIPARYAVEMFEYLYGGALAAKEMLADEIRDGKIRAYAEHSWVSQSRSAADVIEARPPKDAASKVMLSPKELRLSEGWTDQARAWDWHRGRFFALTKKSPTRWMVFSRVQFVEEDIDALLIDSKKAREKELSNRGRKTRQDGWDDVWLTILKLATTEPFTREHVGQQQEFLNKVIKELGGDDVAPLKAGTIDPLIGKIYERFFTSAPA